MHPYKPTNQIMSELREFFAAEGYLTSVAIASVTGINQSQIHRNLFGQPKRLTRTLQKLCKYANLSAAEQGVDPRDNSILMDAISTVWDGSDDHARRLADLLFAHRRAGVGR